MQDEANENIVIPMENVIFYGFEILYAKEEYNSYYNQ